jgi:hypothetical protein
MLKKLYCGFKVVAKCCFEEFRLNITFFEKQVLVAFTRDHLYDWYALLSHLGVMERHVRDLVPASSRWKRLADAPWPFTATPSEGSRC